MKSTNIITRRIYPDGSIGLNINGRDIPDCRDAQADPENDCAYIIVRCGVFNSLVGDVPTPTYDPVPVMVPKRSWLQRMKDRFDAWANYNG